MLGKLGRFGKFLLVMGDMVFVNLALIVALGLRFDGTIDKKYLVMYQENIVILTVIVLGTFMLFRLHSSLWRYASIREFVQVISACVISGILMFLLGSVEGSRFPRSIYILYPLVLMAFTLGIRLSYRLLRYMKRQSDEKNEEKSDTKQSKPHRRVMLVGAGEAASIIIKDMSSNWKEGKKVVLAVDDDESKRATYINGVPVRGKIADVPELVKSHHIEEIIIAMPSVSKRRIAEVVELCNQTDCKLKIFSGIDSAVNPAKSNGGKNLIRDVKVEDLLGREEIVLDNKKLKEVIKNQVVLVTGGGGSIGSELCRQIIRLNPKLLVVFDIYENNAYDLQMELQQNGVPREQLKVLIGSVRDREKLEEVFRLYRPNFVFHAAAHKHVPLMEDSPGEAVKNNVFGTLNVAQCAAAYKVKKFVLVSTDKAVNPTNVMGATKRICEMIVQSINATTKHTDFVAVRFGNVLGSNGSVIPLFKKQLEAGGPLTVTDPNIIRYFMTIPEAVRLILEASTLAKGGEIFVLDMGRPVKILDLAKNLIKLSGLELDRDIQIKFTGLRPGEKLYEELLMSEEGLTKTESDKIFVGKPGQIVYSSLLIQLDKLKAELELGQDIRSALMEVVPTYKVPEYDQQIV